MSRSRKLGPAYNGVMSIVIALRDEALDVEGLVKVWRNWIPEPVGPCRRLGHACDAAE